MWREGWTSRLSGHFEYYFCHIKPISALLQCEYPNCARSVPGAQFLWALLDRVVFFGSYWFVCTNGKVILYLCLELSFFTRRNGFGVMLIVNVLIVVIGIR